MPHHARVPTLVLWMLLALGAVVGVPFVGAELIPGPRPTFDVFLSNFPIAPFFLITAFTFWRRPQHPVARRLLVLGTCPTIALGLGEILSVLWLAAGPKPWYWLLAVAGQVAELGGVAGGIALAAVFPDGVYGRRYERWIVVVVVRSGGGASRHLAVVLTNPGIRPIHGLGEAKHPEPPVHTSPGRAATGGHWFLQLGFSLGNRGRGFIRVEVSTRPQRAQRAIQVAPLCSDLFHRHGRTWIS